MKTWAQILAALEAHGRCALVSVVKTEGSAPRDAGARMVVTPEGFLRNDRRRDAGMAGHRCCAGAVRRAAMRSSSHAMRSGPILANAAAGASSLQSEVFDHSAWTLCGHWQSARRRDRLRCEGASYRPDHIETFGEAATAPLSFRRRPCRAVRWCWRWRRYPSRSCGSIRVRRRFPVPCRAMCAVSWPPIP